MSGDQTQIRLIQKHNVMSAPRDNLLVNRKLVFKKHVSHFRTSTRLGSVHKAQSTFMSFTGFTEMIWMEYRSRTVQRIHFYLFQIPLLLILLPPLVRVSWTCLLLYVVLTHGRNGVYMQWLQQENLAIEKLPRWLNRLAALCLLHYYHLL